MIDLRELENSFDEMKERLLLKKVDEKLLEEV